MSQIKYYDTGSTQWIAAIVGAQGAQGSLGTQGTTGLQGVQGFQGTTGLQGAQGVLGQTPAFVINEFTATSGQTTFSLSYTVGTIRVFYNGVLLGSADYTATNGTSIVLNTGAVAGDLVTVEKYFLGASGYQGAQGVQGLQGLQGIQGAQGTQGVQGLQGLQGPIPSVRVNLNTTSSTPSPNSSTDDLYILTAQASAATFSAPSGSPYQGQKLTIRIKDNGTAQTLSWNAIYRNSADLLLPTTTVASKTLYLGFIYNATDTKWDLIAALGNF